MRTSQEFITSINPYVSSSDKIDRYFYIWCLYAQTWVVCGDYNSCGWPNTMFAGFVVIQWELLSKIRRRLGE